MNATDTSPSKGDMRAHTGTNSDICGFRLSLLDTLSQIKGYDNSTSVLRYIVMECVAADEQHSLSSKSSNRGIVSSNKTNGSVLQWCSASVMPLLSSLPSHSAMDALSVIEKEFMSFDSEFRSMYTKEMRQHLHSLEEQKKAEEDCNNAGKDGDDKDGKEEGRDGTAATTSSSDSPHPTLHITLSSLHSVTSHHSIEEEPLLSFFSTVQQQNAEIRASFVEAQSQGMRLLTYLCEEEMSVEQVIDCIRRFKVSFEAEVEYLKREKAREAEGP